MKKDNLGPGDMEGDSEPVAYLEHKPVCFNLEQGSTGLSIPGEGHAAALHVQQLEKYMSVLSLGKATKWSTISSYFAPL